MDGCSISTALFPRLSSVTVSSARGASQLEEAGHLICELYLERTGIDPFLPKEQDVPEGVCLRRRSIAEEVGTYKGILFYHSLEHVRNPGRDLACARNHLEPGGCVMVRIPLADSLAFWRYGAEWYQIDAPRHLNVFIRKSFGILARECGFEIIRIWNDSTKYQFCYSEEYRKGICLSDPHSLAHDAHPAHLSRDDIARFARWTTWVNEMDIGDQGTFLLKARE